MKCSYRWVRLVVLLTLIITAAGLALPSQDSARAQTITPKITVSANVHPTVQLDSDFSVVPPAGVYNDDDDGIYEPGTDDDDLRFVDVDIVANTNVEFWAVEMTCTVDKNTLEELPQVLGNDNGEDDRPMIWPLWGMWDAQVITPYNPATGSFSFTLARYANQGPVGEYGRQQAITLLTVRYQVKDLTANRTSPVTCSGIQFLNDDGKPVVTPTFVAPPPIQILTGYSVSGKVTYQGRTSHAGIGVECAYTTPPNPPGPVYTARTDAVGNFTINNIRVLGNVHCIFFPNVNGVEVATSPPDMDADVYLAQQSWANIWSNNYRFLPVELRLGNANLNFTPQPPPNSFHNPPDANIDGADISLITGAWNTTVPTPNTGGDVNGDKLVNRADLAIAAANFSLWNSRWPDSTLFGLARGFVNNAAANRIYLGVATPHSWYQEVTQYLPGTNRVFWPALSPDGNKIAYVQKMGTSEYALYIANADGTAPKRLTTAPFGNGFNAALAPSWNQDSNRLAFICGRNEPAFLQNNAGNICLVDMQGISLSWIPAHAKVYPPAWLHPNSLMFGGTNANPFCPDSLCYIENIFGDPFIEALSSFIPDNSKADMPNYTGNPSGGYLFYRKEVAPGQFTLVMASTSQSMGPPPSVVVEAAYESNCTGQPLGVEPAAFHCELRYDADHDPPPDPPSPSTLSGTRFGYVSYYTLRHTQVLFYTHENPTAWHNMGYGTPPNGQQFGQGFLEFNDPGEFYISGMIGEPYFDYTEDYFDPANATLLWLERPTADSQ